MGVSPMRSAGILPVPLDALDGFCLYGDAGRGIMPGMDRTGTSRLRVLGIDPGLNITGYAVVDFSGPGSRIVEAGAIRPPRQGDLGRRMGAVHADVTELLREHRPDHVAIEQLYSHASFPRTAILMAYARGAVLLACHQAQVGVVSLPPNLVKKALTGNGHAGKRQMQLAIQDQCGLEAAPAPPDVADAIAVALCAGRRLTAGAAAGIASPTRGRRRAHAIGAPA
jgi:crossover junction endodeoxyribonuclease RuvC